MNQVTVAEICLLLDQSAPWSLTESWDNTGLLVGDPGAGVTAILFGLDPTPELLDEAIALEANLVITHHPIIFHPLKNLTTTAPGHRVIAKAIHHRINLVACHTNWDAAPDGVNAVLASGLGLRELAPLAPASGRNGCGLGRIGTLSPPLEPEEFLHRVRQVLAAPWLLSAGPRPERVSRVALCGGSCSDLAQTAVACGAQVFLTSEVKHAAARFAEEAGLWLIDGGHFATEFPAMAVLAGLLEKQLQAAGWSQAVRISRQDPPLQLVHGSAGAPVQESGSIPKC